MQGCRRAGRSAASLYAAEAGDVPVTTVITSEECAMSEGPWFRRSRDGRRWTPITWEGWVVTVLGAFIVTVANLALIFHVLRR
jgi:hypothetical protein